MNVSYFFWKNKRASLPWRLAGATYSSSDTPGRHTGSYLKLKGAD